MPPWKPAAGVGGPFVGARGLTNDQIATIARWVDAGMPRGDEGAPAAAAERLPEWRLGPPDLVVTLEQPYTLEADGPDVFRNFAIPIPVDGLKFVAAVDFSPGGVRAIHHANLRFDQSATSRELDAEDKQPGYEGAISMSARYPDGYFLGWTPGQSPLASAPGMAWRLARGNRSRRAAAPAPHRQAGRASGRRSRSTSRPDAPTRTPLALRLGKQNIDIKPGEQYLVADAYQLPVDVELLAIHPHAHYRAKEIRATADLPDGTRRWLLRIDDWDFNWQDVYRFAEPVALPKGTTIRMLYTYDNSDANPRNPDQAAAAGRLRTELRRRNGRSVAPGRHRDRRRPRRRCSRTSGRRRCSRTPTGYTMLVAANPDNAGYHNDLAFVSALLGRFDAAIEHYERRRTPEARLGGPALQRRHAAGRAAPATRRRCPTSARRSRSAPITPRPTTISAPSSRRSARAMKRSNISAARSRWIRRTSRPKRTWRS